MSEALRWGAVIVAAGRGTRFGKPKQLVPIAGEPMLVWSVRAFAAMPEVAQIVVVTEAEWIDAVRDAVFTAAPAAAIVPGGASRRQSAEHGLRALDAGRCDAAFIHDGARPLVRAQDVRSGMARVAPGAGALLATPVIDTIKDVDADGRVAQTFRRDRLWAAQTPQFGMLDDLLRAHAAAQVEPFDATDDAMLLERIGVEVYVVESTVENFKVTLPADRARADALMRERLAEVS